SWSRVLASDLLLLGLIAFFPSVIETVSEIVFTSKSIEDTSLLLVSIVIFMAW
ncbi:hypothetical protein PanWU01x14_265630, partial [Parasponia andersonii]